MPHSCGYRKSSCFLPFLVQHHTMLTQLSSKLSKTLMLCTLLEHFFPHQKHQCWQRETASDRGIVSTSLPMSQPHVFPLMDKLQQVNLYLAWNSLYIKWWTLLEHALKQVFLSRGLNS